MLRRAVDSLLKSYLRTGEHPGKYRVVRWLGRHAIPPAGLVSTVPPGIRLKLHPGDWIEYLMLRGEAYEPMTLEFMTKNLRPGDTAVLAGVNFGLHVSVAARAVGASGRVIGIEPQAAALLRTLDNLALNGLEERVELVSGAIGGADRFCHMAWSRPDNRGAASVYDQGPGFLMRISTLSDVLQAAGGPKPRILLLDVQGCEVEALDGIAAGPLPEIVVVEYAEDFLERAGTTGVQLFDRIVALGYDVYTVHGKPLGRDDREIPEHNVFGVPPGSNPVWIPARPTAH
jgi:FkbM family methyltransferase